MPARFRKTLIATLLVPAIGAGAALAQDASTGDRNTPAYTYSPPNYQPGPYREWVYDKATGWRASDNRTGERANDSNGMRDQAMRYDAASRTGASYDERAGTDGSGARNYKASNVIGSGVVSPQGQDLGEVKDFVVDMRSGKVRYVVVSFDPGFMTPERLHAIPPSAFERKTRGDRLVLNMDRRQLSQAPAFEKGGWPEWNDRGFTADVDRYYGNRIDQGTQARLRRASDLIGEDVRDRNGEDLGHVNDLVVSMPQGRVRYAVIELDNLFRIPDRMAPVPLRSLQFGPDDDHLVAAVDSSQLDHVMTFSGGRWPDLNDSAYQASVDRELGNPVWGVVVATGTNGNDRTAGNAGQVRTSSRTGMGDRSYDADRMFGRIDSNNDGVISREEFFAQFGGDRTTSQQEKRRAFDAFDNNDNNRIERREFNQYHELNAAGAAMPGATTAEQQPSSSPQNPSASSQAMSRDAGSAGAQPGQSAMSNDQKASGPSAMSKDQNASGPSAMSNDQSTSGPSATSKDQNASGQSATPSDQTQQNQGMGR